MNVVNITINNNKINTKYNYNIIQACNENNINIPKFCYHSELSISGNCRMCLVEVNGITKPIASCAIPISKNIIIYTESKLVKKAREGILEFILINHPLDCPICDQGGECDLQDQSLVFGSDKGRFYEYKRSVNDKDCGPFIKTIMTRCIHCTRCIRFLDEISGFKYLGLIGRGPKIEISNFVNKIIYSELSGNIVDLCPVGALTFKTYSFKARPWELNSFNSIDLVDPFHVNIRIDIRDTNILRILPIYNNILNENWISDLTRYSFDGLNKFRLINPLKQTNNKFIIISWLEVFNTISKLFNSNNNLNLILGDFLDMETSIILKKVISKNFINSNISIKSKNNIFNNDFRNNYFISNKDLNNLLEFDNIVLINTNIRLSNPLLNLKLKNFSNFKGNIFSIGSSYYYNFNLYNYSVNFISLLTLVNGKSDLSLFLHNNNNLFILNNNMVYNNFINDWLNFITKFTYYMNLTFYLYENSSNQNKLFNEINLTNSLSKFNDISLNKFATKIINNINYFINFNFYFNNRKKSFNPTVNIYQGSHFLPNKSFDFLLPSVNSFEKNAIYVNFLGYYQKTKFLLYPPKNSRSDWKIIFFLFSNRTLKSKLNFNDFINYNFFYNLFYNESFYNINHINLKDSLLNKLNFINTFNDYNYYNMYKLNYIAHISKNIFNIYKKIKQTHSNFY